AALDPTAAIGFVECAGDGRSGRIAVAIQIHKHLVAGNAESIRDGLDDADIRLMRNNAGNVLDGGSGLVEDFPGGVQQSVDSLFVNFLAAHVDRCQMHIDIFPRDQAARTAARHEQNLGVLAVAADVSADDTVRAATMTQNGSASAISKDRKSVV